MNIVFWIGVIIALFLVWISFTYYFRYIGSIFKRMFHETKEEITKKDEEDLTENER